MSDEDRHLPPWALWTVFEGFPQWFFARGYPPTLRDPRRWVRAMRVTVLVVFLALVAAWGIAVLVTLANPSSVMDVDTLAGMALGAVVLVPMSRWMGRPWWLALSVIPFAGLSGYLADHVPRFEWISPWINGDGLSFGAIFGFLIAVGVLGLWPPRAWLLILLCTVSSMLGCSQVGTVWDGARAFMDLSLLNPNMAGLFRTAAAVLLVFWSVTLPLGIWLWDPPRE